MKKTKNESTKYKLPKKKLTKGLDLTPLFVRGFIPQEVCPFQSEFALSNDRDLLVGLSTLAILPSIKVFFLKRIFMELAM